MDYKGNKAARRELKYGGGPRKPMNKGRMAYKHGGPSGCQPVYKGTPQAKAN